MTRSRLTSSRRGGRRAAVAGVVASLALGLVSCTGGEEPEAAETGSTVAPTSTPPETASTTTIDRPEARWQVSVEQLRGGVQSKQRPVIAHAIRRTLAGWVGSAFRGDYPRENFRAAFSGWTRQAAGMARKDRRITTNAVLGPDLVDLVSDRLQARLFVFASRGNTGGATARVFLRFTGARSSGDLVRLTVKGDVRLTRERAHWRIFAYDLVRMVEAR